MQRSHRWHHLAALIMCVAHGALLFGMPFFVKGVLKATPGQIGIMSLLGPGTYVVACLKFSALSDRIGRKKFLVVGPLVFGLCFLIMSRATSIWQVYCLQIPQGLASGAFWPSLQASLADSTPPERLSKVLGVFNIAWTGGQTIGMLMAGLAYDWTPTGWQEQSPLLVAVGAAMLTGAVAMCGLPRSRPAGESADESLDGAAKGGPASGPPPPEHRGNAFFVAALVSNFVGIGTVVTVRIFFVEIARDLGYGGSGSSILLAMTCVSQAVAFAILGRSGFWHYRRAPLFAAQAVMAAACLYMAWGSSYHALMVAGMIAGACVGITYASSLFYGLDRGAAKGASSGLHEAALGAGASVVPFIGGQIADFVRFDRAAYISAPCLVALAMVIQVLILRRRGASRKPE